MTQLADIESALRGWLDDNAPADDPAHDRHHVLRVWRTARELAAEEGADPLVVMAASLLHDCVNLPKDHPERAQASRMAAELASTVMARLSFPAAKIPAVAHAIAAHSFSAGIRPETIEAMVVQDADRLDALGAVGIARCYVIGGRLGRTIADPNDPLAEHRALDDSTYSLDYFAAKLLKLPELMLTPGGCRRAKARAAVLVAFRAQLADELLGSG